jgi:hypothetical protein
MRSSLQRLSRFEIVIFYPVAVLTAMLFLANMLELFLRASTHSVVLSFLGALEMFGLWMAPLLFPERIWIVRICLWPLFILMIAWVIFAGAVAFG